ncbi:unnamed protein product [Alternaria alternata]
MFEIPNMSLDTARDELGDGFARRIDVDFKHSKCIWCKAGGTKTKKKNHSLMNCPTTKPAENDQTSLSNEIFNAGKEGAAIAYIHQKQLSVYPRDDNATTFSTGLSRPHASNYTVSVKTAPAPPSAPSGLSFTPIIPVPSPQPPASSATQGVSSSIPSTSIDQSSSGFASSSVVPTTGSTPAATAPISVIENHILPNMLSDQPHTEVATQSSAFGLNAVASVASAVPTTNLQDAPVVNFGELTRYNRAPGSSAYANGNSDLVDTGELNGELERLKDTALQYPIRQSLRERPKKGEVLTNYFKISIDPQTTFYEYQVLGIPDSESRAGKKRYMDTAIRNVPFLYSNRDVFATDNVNTIVAWVNLHQHIPGVRVQSGDLMTDVGSTWALLDIVDRDTTVPLGFQYLRPVDIFGLQQYSNTTRPDPFNHDPHPAENALNIIMTRCFASSNTLQLNNHKFYVRNAYFDLKTNEGNAVAPLRALRGYSYRVHSTLGNILLNVSPANSAFWRPLLVSQIYQNGSGPFGNSKDHVKRALRGVRVYIDYSRETKDKKCKHPKCNDPNCSTTIPPDKFSARTSSNMDGQHARIKTIRGFGKACSEQTFLWEHKDVYGNIITGQSVQPTVQEYQQRQYARVLQHPGLPAVNVGTAGRPTWFAPEHLRILPDQIYAKIIPDFVANDFHRNACREPREIRSRIEQEGLRHIPITATGQLENCHPISLDPRMLQIPFVHLNPATIMYSSTTVTKTVNENTGRWDLKETQFFRGNAKSLKWLLITGQGVDRNDKMRPKNLDWSNDSALGQYMANVAMKENLKMAGINHSAQGVEEQLENTIVIGADVTHPGSGALQGTPSIAAIVSSLEANGGRFRGNMRLQSAKQEIIPCLGDMLIEGLSEWCRLHRRFPENVLYYRDGVSDTQYDEVITKELSTIKNAFIGVAKQFKKPVPEFKTTAVIVTKRHNTRFFPRQKDDEMRGNGNCKPGLLVESSITSPYYTDFYLQSHNAIKGTARSSHYFVLQNEMGIEISDLEDLTHNLCHTYVRATTGVSYASPAYYADRLAERGRCYLREWFNPSNTKRNAYETHCQQVEADVEAARNRPQRTGNHKKTPAEIQEDKADREQILQQMRDYIWPVVETRWNTPIHDLAESGFRPNAKAKYDHLKGTMYWM